METKDNDPKQSKSPTNYNRLYYQKHREKLLERKKMRSKSNVFPLFLKPSRTQTPSIWTRLLSKVELLCLIGLSTAMTLFLVAESAGFYLDAHESPETAYLKAGIVEGVAVLFSLARGKTLFLRWSQRTLALLLCGLTLWTIAGKLLKNASHQEVTFTVQSKTVLELESEQTQKESLRNKFLELGWLTAAKRYEKELDQVRGKLASARLLMDSMHKPEVILNNLGILLAFRFLVVVANLICIHRIIEEVGLYIRKSETLTNRKTELLLN